MINVTFDPFTLGYADFEMACIEVFRKQYESVQIYQDYCKALNVTPTEVKRIRQIPFLPIQFFKSHEVKMRGAVNHFTFLSSGTGNQSRSKRFVLSHELYEKSFMEGFKRTYGSPSQFVILALLPNYIEQGNSSLLYMVDQLIKETNNSESGFYLDNYDKLATTIQSVLSSNRRLMLIGVSYALLEFAERFPMDLQHSIVMETGGMKGRRKELTRAELHHELKQSFELSQIHSEYGMTELYSQAYAEKDGVFNHPKWMRVLIREPKDPFSFHGTGRAGGVNIIDLANLDAVSFIETQDLGKLNNDLSFEILGRFDDSELRGCSLMYSGSS